MPKKIHTPEQREIERLKLAKWRKKKRDEHACVCCGKKDKRTKEGRAFCFRCAVKNSAYRKKLRERKKNNENLDE